MSSEEQYLSKPIQNVRIAEESVLRKNLGVGSIQQTIRDHLKTMASAKEHSKSVESERIKNLGVDSMQKTIRDHLEAIESARVHWKSIESEQLKDLGAGSIQQTIRDHLKAMESAQVRWKSVESGQLKDLAANSIQQSIRDHWKTMESDQKIWKSVESEHLKNLRAIQKHLKTMEFERIKRLANDQTPKCSIKMQELSQVVGSVRACLEDGFASLNLNPDTSLASLLKNTNYAASSSEALNKDWHKIGYDLWRSWAAIKDEDKHE